MNRAPKTGAEARALPEVANTLTEGLFLGAGGLDGDSIMAFVDSDGVAKRVECIRRSLNGPDEWVKTPIYL